MGDVIQWAVDPYSGHYYPLNLGLGLVPTVLFTLRPRGGHMWRVDLPGIALADEDRWHDGPDAAKAAAVRLVVELHGPRIRAEAARLAEVEAWLKGGEG